jgi:hypothetical protein
MAFLCLFIFVREEKDEENEIQSNGGGGGWVASEDNFVF